MKKLWGVIDFEEEERRAALISRSHIQDPYLFRLLFRARCLADHLIDATGHFDQGKLDTLSILLKKEKSPRAIQGGGDEIAKRHISHVIAFFHKNKQSQELIRRFKTPVSNRYIEQLISYSIGVNTPIRDPELRKAVLSALFTPLRQTIGSCFATAPAILIQSEQIERLILDLYDLISMSKLKRTFSGTQHAVPISPNWGLADLKQTIDLKNQAIAYAPGLMHAFVAANILSSSEKDIAKLLSKVKSKRLSCQTLIRLVLAEHFKLSKENTKLFCEEHQPSNFVSYPLEAALDAEKKAYAAFQATTHHPLLKAWEFTLASFTDYQIDFYRWNLYVSLGFDHREQGGIGELLYQTLQERLDIAYHQTIEYEREYQEVSSQIQVIQSLLRQATTYHKIKELRTRLEMYLNQSHSLHDLYDQAAKRTRRLSSLFQFLIERYIAQFPSYFQEIYDPNMVEMQKTLYDDSVAGFRLVYKHGRSDPLLWTPILDRKGYQNTLRDFFLSVEPALLAMLESEEDKPLVEDLTGKLSLHVQTDLFMSSAEERIQQRDETTKRFAKTPWSYLSGGSMTTLLSCYYCLEKEMQVAKNTPSSPFDLLVFLFELLKDLPYRITRLFENNPDKGMLMFSPSHAFILKPGLSPFQEGWRNRHFTYSWVRDHCVIPAQNFYENITLDQDEALFLSEKFFKTYGVEGSCSFPFSSFSLVEWRQTLFSSLNTSYEVFDLIDAFLSSAFPLISHLNAKTMTETILKCTYPEKMEALHDLSLTIEKNLHQYMTFADFKRTLREALFALDPSVSWHRLCSDLNHALAKEDISPPQPLLFADTNWPSSFFAFAFNPGKHALDLWRFDPLGEIGYPMSMWEEHFNGMSTWGVLTEPDEYSGMQKSIFPLLGKKV